MGGTGIVTTIGQFLYIHMDVWMETEVIVRKVGLDLNATEHILGVNRNADGLPQGNLLENFLKKSGAFYNSKLGTKSEKGFSKNEKIF